MTRKKFTELINEFIDIYCSEYLSDARWEWDDDYDETPAANIKCTSSYRGLEWEVPIIAGKKWPSDKEDILINACPDMDVKLRCDGEGLYLYLFFEAVGMIPQEDK